jgi:inner membrane protein
MRILGTSGAMLLDPDRPAPPIDALPPGSVQARDVRRFRQFSGNLMGVHPKHPDVVGDLRYASRPDLIDPLWGIVVNAARADRHVKLAFFRDPGDGSAQWLWRRVLGIE